MKQIIPTILASRLKTVTLWTAIGLLTTTVVAGEPQPTQEPDEGGDFMAMSLEDLLDVQVEIVTWKVARVRTLDEAGAHKFIFFARTHANRRWNGIGVGEPRGVLTFGEQAPRAGRAAIFSFVVVKGRIRFDVNMAMAREAGVSMDSRLLKPARTVRVKRTEE